VGTSPSEAIVSTVERPMQTATGTLRRSSAKKLNTRMRTWISMAGPG
jgi:hypothetical protein